MWVDFKREAEQICNTYSMDDNVSMLYALFDYCRSMKVDPDDMVGITEAVQNELAKRNGGNYRARIEFD